MCRRSILTCKAFLLVLLVGCAEDPPNPSATVSKIAAAQAALSLGNLDRARQLALEITVDDPDWAVAQLVAAYAELQQGDTDGALRHLHAIPRDGTQVSLAAALSMGEIEQRSGRLSAAIDSYAYVLEHDPQQHQAATEIANLLAATGQRWRADAYLAELVKLPDFGFRQLVLLTDFERRDPDVIHYLRECETQHPDDPAVNLGLAFEAFADGDLADARRRVEAVLAADPELGAAQGLLGEILLDASDDEMQIWHAALPQSLENDPHIWYVRGLWARRLREKEVAVRCLWECACQMPTSHRAMHQLGIAISEVDRALGEKFTRCAEEIFVLNQHLSNALNTFGRDEAEMQHVIRMLIDAGREWEAFSWTIVADGKYPNSTWVDRALDSLSAYPHTDAPRLLNSGNLLVLHDLSHYPDFATIAGVSPHHSLNGESRTSVIRFADQADEYSVDFSYYQGRVEGIDGVRMQESTGGGIAVFDFDGDGATDFFLSQGELWNFDTDQPTPSEEHQDCLLRNRATLFQDVTSPACLPLESGFGQGCSAGDFNNDGFVDLYIANVGVNQLLINQGDGTFHDATSVLNLSSSTWTTSCLIADLNGDGNPDLFDVNYVEGEHLFRMICSEHECSPEQYQSSVDQLHLSRGDGTVALVDLSDVERGGGAGLALVAFRVPDSTSHSDPSLADVDVALGVEPTHEGFNLGTHPKRLSLFIGNDHEPNFFLINAPSDHTDNIQLSEVAFVTGLAVSAQGRANACMGVASGDVNGDGMLDLFVTNYKDEANNLFLQSSDGFFSDSIAGVGLLAPGLPYVGWGTQFLDADNDGRLDLVVTNGHVGDFEKPDVEYYMPTQVFRQELEGRFAELPPETLGPFFSRKLLGRSLARVDWNRDGRTDFVLSPIEAPVALLTNTTTEAGNFLQIRLHARSTARDAIGSLVTVVTDAGSVQQQLTAGDGYLVSNERVLHFGLGSTDIIESATIEWPGGVVQTIQNIPANCLLEVIEGQRHITQWRGAKPMAFIPATTSVDPSLSQASGE